MRIYLDKIQNVFLTAYRAGQNPLQNVFEAFYKNDFLKNRVFVDNPYFLIDTKRALNDLIDRHSLSGLYQFKFPAHSLIYPEPTVFLNLNKAKIITLSNSLGEHKDFYIAQTIEKNHSDYMCLLENAKSVPYMIRFFRRPDGDISIDPVTSENENRELLDIYDDNLAIFSA